MGLFLSVFSLFFVPVSLLNTKLVYNDFNFIYNSSIDYIFFLSGGCLILLISWLYFSRKVSNNNFFYFLIFGSFVYLYISTNNFIIFFFCYELFLLPSFLLVFFLSPNRRGIIASIYFLMWTQVGSFLVFFAVIASIFLSNSFYFSESFQVSWVLLLFFLGFGIKVPVWPFHYWLTKTHVEAPTYFSIYLSGFLVKTALYGLWVFCFKNPNNLMLFFLVVSVVGIIDSSLKMWSQVDLKKLVAYGTVQEMNLILFCFCLGNLVSIQLILLFILAHTLLSTIFFGLVDSIYKRFNSRSVYAVKGLSQTTPMLAYSIFICCLFFAGLPFTLKFIVEVYVFSQVMSFNFFFLLILILICNWFGLVFFTKNWLSTIFGTPTTAVYSDISVVEIVFYVISLSLLFLLSFYTFILF